MSDLENFVNQSGRDKLVKDVRKKNGVPERTKRRNNWIW